MENILLNNSTQTSHLFGHSKERPVISLADLKFEDVAIYLIVALFVLAVILLKIAYHKFTFIAAYFPESLLLICAGLIFGAILKLIPTVDNNNNSLRLTPTLFFNILLPPLVLESAYSVYNRTFANLFGTIIFFAVAGTVFNFLVIGGGLLAISSLIGFGGMELGLGIREYLLFASLIVAVDPVAVLAIFQDIGVDLNLYFLVFGESLLNDAVTVFLYNLMSAFVASNIITYSQILIGIGSFFTVSFGGALIGLVHGIISCLITRLNIRADALVLLVMGYLSYIVGDLFGWSGIISMIVCGIIQAAYAFHNLNSMSVIFLKSALKQISSVSEAIIFLLIGSEVIILKLNWHIGFITSALVLCLVARFITVFFSTAIVNKTRTSHTRIKWTEQIIISYGGLRGAVSFSLAILLNPEFLGKYGATARDVLITSTLVVILFTVAVMGTTMKPLVRLLHIQLVNKDENKLVSLLNNSVIDNSLFFIEQLTLCSGVNKMRHIGTRLDDKYIRPLLQRNAVLHNAKIIAAYEKMVLQMHSDAISNLSTLDESKDDTLNLPLPRAGIYNDAFDKSMFKSMSTKVRQKLQILRLLQDPHEEAYQQNSSHFNRATDAHFARFSKNQRQLTSQINTYLNKKPKIKKTLSLDIYDESRLANKRRQNLERTVPSICATKSVESSSSLLANASMQKNNCENVSESINKK